MSAKVFDMLGNEIGEGSTLFWKTIGAVVNVLEVKPGGLLIPGAGNQKTQGEIALAIRIPFDSDKPLAYLKEFIAVVNPADQKAVGELISKDSNGHNDKTLKVV